MLLVLLVQIIANLVQLIIICMVQVVWLHVLINFLKTLMFVQHVLLLVIIVKLLLIIVFLAMDLYIYKKINVSVLAQMDFINLFKIKLNNALNVLFNVKLVHKLPLIVLAVMIIITF